MKKFPYSVYTGKMTYETNLWCEQYIGKQNNIRILGGGDWACFWQGYENGEHRRYKWFFRNEKDAILFTLRWA